MINPSTFEPSLTKVVSVKEEKFEVEENTESNYEKTIKIAMKEEITTLKNTEIIFPDDKQFRNNIQPRKIQQH